MAAWRAPEILRIVYEGVDGVAIERPFDEDLVTVLTDRAPMIRLLVRGSGIRVDRSAGSELGDLEQERVDPEGPPTWRIWKFGKDLSKERRAGFRELALKSPPVSIKLYFVPGRLLTVRDLLLMAEQIEAELGLQILWDTADVAVRAWAKRKRAATTVEQLLEYVESELVAARVIRRDPILEPGLSGAAAGAALGLVAAPENAIVSHWAARRLCQMAEHRERWRGLSHRLQAQLGSAVSDTRKQQARKELAYAQGVVHQLVGVESIVGAMVASRELAEPVTFGPLAQRDHRLRRMLRAFASPMSEVLSEEKADLSAFPPTTLNDLFERWGGVWIVQQVLRFGFRLVRREPEVPATPEGCRWVFEMDAVEITFDYELHPPRIEFEPEEAVSANGATALEQALLSAGGDGVYASRKRSSPDYIIRVRGPAGATMAVGDAALADPAYGTRDREAGKPRVVFDYRTSLFWRLGDEVVPCHPFGGFVLLPGPSERWSEARSWHIYHNVWFLCPQLRVHEPLVEARFDAMLERLLAAVR